MSELSSDQFEIVVTKLSDKGLLKFEIPDELLAEAGLDIKKLSPDQLKAIFAQLAEKGLLKPKPSDKKSVGEESGTKEPEGAQGSHPGLVKKKVTVKRDNKTSEEYRWVKAGEDEPVEKPKKGDEEVTGEVPGKGGEELEEKPRTEPEPEKPKGPVILGLNKPEDEDSNDDIDTKTDVNGEDEKTTIEETKDKIDTKDTKNMGKQMEAYVEYLNNSESEKVKMYSVRKYTGGTYVEINQYLRDGRILPWGEDKPREPTEDEKKEIEEQISGISDFINSAPKVEGTVHRGMSWDMKDDEAINSYNEFTKNIVVGETIEMKNFASTTPKKNVMEQFSPSQRGHNRLSLEIETKSGVYLNGLSKYGDQHEILLNHGSKFEIIDFVSPTTRGKRGILKLKEI